MTILRGGYLIEPLIVTIAFAKRWCLETKNLSDSVIIANTIREIKNVIDENLEDLITIYSFLLARTDGYYFNDLSGAQQDDYRFDAGLLLKLFKSNIVPTFLYLNAYEVLAKVSDYNCPQTLKYCLSTLTELESPVVSTNEVALSAKKLKSYIVVTPTQR